MTEIPLTEFDASVPAIIEPSQVVAHDPDFPEYVVMCFFQDAIQVVCKDAPKIAQTASEIGKNPIFCIEHEGQAIAVLHAGVGAPLSGSFLEEVIAMGGRKFIACGGAGVLDPAINMGDVIIPTAAIRDEGTSYHYLPPSAQVQANPIAVQACVDALDAHDIPHVQGKTWTTDGVYRETAAKVKARHEAGAICVEMECAAFFAIAQFRDVVFGQFLYGGDDVSPDGWDHRGWDKQASVREKLLWLAVDAVLRL